MNRTTWVITGHLSCAALAFLIGRQIAPTPDVQVHEVERVVYRDRVTTVTQREAAQVRDVVVYRDRVTTPDGTVREREVERAVSTAVERERAAQVAERVQVRDVERRIEVRAPTPAWRVSALAGVPIRLPPAPVVVGVHIQRRLWGPLTAGAWTLAPVQPGAPIVVGVSVGVEF